MIRRPIFRTRLAIKSQSGLTLDTESTQQSTSVRSFNTGLPDAPFDPWIGLGMGYEWLTISESGTLTVAGVSEAFDGNVTGKGLQFINLQAGGDCHVSPAFGLGPFISFSAGQYSSYSSTVTAAGVEQKQSGDISQGTHEWLTLGVRGQFNI